jgi:hypothetical protein
VGAAGPDEQTYVAVVVQGDQALAYVCDGRSVGHWLGGEVVDGSLQLASAAGTHLDARIEAGVVEGTLRLGGKALAFTARPAVEGRTGLYRLEDEPEPGYTLGWIQLETGIRGLATSSKGTVKAAISTNSSETTSSGSQQPPTLQLAPPSEEEAGDAGVIDVDCITLGASCGTCPPNAPLDSCMEAVHNCVGVGGIPYNPGGVRYDRKNNVFVVDEVDPYEEIRCAFSLEYLEELYGGGSGGGGPASA